MPTYYTVKHLAAIFHRSEQTIRRWVDEGRDISFDGKRYDPQKDPGGEWLFVVQALVVEPAEPAPAVQKRPVRRIYSPGI